MEHPGKSGSSKKNEKVRNLGFLLTLLLVVALIPLGTKFYATYNAKKAVYKEKIKEEQQIHQEVDRLLKKNNEMKERQKTLQTHQGVEKVARDKLGLTKANEIPLVIKKDGQNHNEENTDIIMDKKEKTKTEKKTSGKLERD